MAKQRDEYTEEQVHEIFKRYRRGMTVERYMASCELDVDWWDDWKDQYRKKPPTGESKAGRPTKIQRHIKWLDKIEKREVFEDETPEPEEEAPVPAPAFEKTPPLEGGARKAKIIARCTNIRFYRIKFIDDGTYAKLRTGNRDRKLVVNQPVTVVLADGPHGYWERLRVSARAVR